MTKPINEYTMDELSAKIEAIKAERERTANALKHYEEELERRKQEVPLGVPLENIPNVYYFHNATFSVFGAKSKKQPCVDEKLLDYLGLFHSKESAEKHTEMLLAWRKALVANAKGEPIDIEVLLPLLKKGWVAMDEDNTWFWYPEKPEQTLAEWVAGLPAVTLPTFNIKPADDWKTSLQECGL